jgi:hypothetical protein
LGYELRHNFRIGQPNRHMNFKTDFFPSLGLLTDYLVNDSFRNTRRSAINKEANRDPPLQFREMAVSVVVVIERLGRPKILREMENDMPVTAVRRCSRRCSGLPRITRYLSRADVEAAKYLGVSAATLGSCRSRACMVEGHRCVNVARMLEQKCTRIRDQRRIQRTCFPRNALCRNTRPPLPM